MRLPKLSVKAAGMALSATVLSMNHTASRSRKKSHSCKTPMTIAACSTCAMYCFLALHLWISSSGMDVSSADRLPVSGSTTKVAMEAGAESSRRPSDAMINGRRRSTWACRC